MESYQFAMNTAASDLKVKSLAKHLVRSGAIRDGLSEAELISFIQNGLIKLKCRLRDNRDVKIADGLRKAARGLSKLAAAAEGIKEVPMESDC